MEWQCKVARRALWATPGLCAAVLSHGAEPDGDPSAASSRRAAAPEGGIQTVEVIAVNLDKARNGLSPKSGTSQYVFDQRDIHQMPRGDNTPLSQIMLQAPGVAQGDYGELHVRGEMVQPQYRINGTIVPEGISGFGQTFDSRFAQRIEFITGALPAQYNYRTNIIEITTKQRFENGGQASLHGGSYGRLNPSVEFSGASDRLTYYLTGSYLQAKNGVLFPTSERQSNHNETNQSKGFALVSLLPDPGSRLSLMLGTARSRFQIPNVPGETLIYPLDGVDLFPNLPSAKVDERQRETNRYTVLSYERSSGKGLDYQVALFAQYSSVLFTPDPIGDLIYRGIASQVARSSHAIGLQLDSSLQLTEEHTMRAGLSVGRQRTASNNKSVVFPADADGVQVPGAPIGVLDSRSIAANLIGMYLQDEWRVSGLITLNYGVRLDHLAGPTRDGQISPRLNAVYKIDERTSVHAGYARYFNPPRLELIGPDTVSKFLNTTNQPEVLESSPVVPERIHYMDAGWVHRVTPDLNLGVDVYAKYGRNMIDFGQFGRALVYSPFNWSKSRIYGLEFTAHYGTASLSAYFNAAVSWARAKGISSGQYNFEREELDYINRHWVYMDHDQRLTSSAGASYKWSELLLLADVCYGSGMRITREGGTPNSDHLPGYVQANVGVGREIQTSWPANVDLRLSVVNLFDKSYKVRDGTGIGVGAPQFGPRRSVYASLSASF